MKLKNVLIGSMILSSTLFAGGDITPVEPVTEEAAVESWDFSASLYMWGAGINGETALYGEIDIPFSDILDNLDMGYMGTIRTQKGKWGIESDFIYMKLGNNIDDNQLVDKFSYKAWIVTPAVTYQVIDSESLNLHILAGARYLYMKPTITTTVRGGNVIDPRGGSVIATSGDLWDGIIGVKGTYVLNEKWFMPFQADIGTGDTDVTWQVFAGIGYKYENFDLIAGYRYLEWSFEDNNPGGDVFNDLSFSGPMFGAKFRF